MAGNQGHNTVAGRQGFQPVSLGEDRRASAPVPTDDASGGCACAKNADGSVTSMLCPQHADNDPCQTKADVTGRRRKGSIVNGVCTGCGWSNRQGRDRGVFAEDDPALAMYRATGGAP